MNDLIFRIKATYWFHNLTDLGYIDSWKYSKTLLDSYYYEENMEIGPKEAVLSEISYWDE